MALGALQLQRRALKHELLCEICYWRLGWRYSRVNRFLRNYATESKKNAEPQVALVSQLGLRKRLARSAAHTARGSAAARATRRARVTQFLFFVELRAQQRKTLCLLFM